MYNEGYVEIETAIRLHPDNHRKYAIPYRPTPLLLFFRGGAPVTSALRVVGITSFIRMRDFQTIRRKIKGGGEFISVKQPTLS